MRIFLLIGKTKTWQKEKMWPLASDYWRRPGQSSLKMTYKFQTGTMENNNGFDFRYGRFDVTVRKRQKVGFTPRRRDM